MSETMEVAILLQPCSALFYLGQGVLSEIKKVWSYKSILPFSITQIERGAWDLKELWSHLQQGGIASLLRSAILQYAQVVQMHLTSNAMLKHEISGHGATCSNSHNCSSFVFFSKTVQKVRNRAKKKRQIK